jgi:predicted Zn-dependent protease
MTKQLKFALTFAALAFTLLATSARGQLFGTPPSRDIEQGTQVAKLVERQIGLYSLPEAEAYLRKVGDRLVTVVNDPRWKFSFQIVDQAEPNAFSIPGGAVYVSRGLLVLIDREDELACVLAHEIAHVTQRHAARQQRKGFLPELLSIPGNVVGNVVGQNLGALINVPIDTVGGAWLSAYSRGQESEADRIGIRTAAQAGYDPAALAQILARLERDVASLTGQERRFSIFDNHPMTKDRMKDIQRRAASLAAAVMRPIAPDRAALFAKLDGLWCAENPEAGVFRQNRFLHPVSGITITFPPGWKHRNTPEYVISVHPQQEALLLLGIAGPASDPEATGKKFIAQIRSEAGISPVSERKTTVGEFPAFVATYQDRSGHSTAYQDFTWVSMGGQTFQLISLAPERHRETLRDATLSLRPLTDTEICSVTSKRLRIITARQGESLENLAARAGNAWSPAYTALVNGLEPEVALHEGNLVKIARMEPVRPGSAH